MRSPDVLAEQLWRYAEHDVSGEPRDEAGKWTASPDELAGSLRDSEDDSDEDSEQKMQDRITTGATNATHEIMGHLADYDEPIPDNLLNEILSSADVDKADRAGVIDHLYDQGMLQLGEDEGTNVPGPTMKAAQAIKEFHDASEGEPMNQFQVTNTLRNIVGNDGVESTIDALIDNGLLTSQGESENATYSFVPRQ